MRPVEWKEGEPFERLGMPRGTFVINCTDQYGEHMNEFEPIVSGGGKVLAPQTCLHGAGKNTSIRGLGCMNRVTDWLCVQCVDRATVSCRCL